jgi:hypothetical protein
VKQKCINSDQQEDLKRKDVTNIVEQKCTSCDSETKRLTYLVCSSVTSVIFLATVPFLKCRQDHHNSQGK